MNNAPQQYDRARVYDFLYEGFGLEDLRRLCAKHFAHIDKAMPLNANLDTYIQRLLGYCDTHNAYARVLEVFQQENPVKYEQFRPYHSGGAAAMPPQAHAEKKADVKTILFVAANPKTTNHLDLDIEYRSTQEQLKSGTHRDHYQCLLPVFAATKIALMQALSQKPQIVHFSGHGGCDGLYLLDAHGFPKTISLTTLQLLFGELKEATECILLNSCYSATQAKSLSELGFTVIGYNRPIGDEPSIAFAQGFYLGLAAGDDYRAAARKGLALLLDDHEEESIKLQVWQQGELLPLW